MKTFKNSPVFYPTIILIFGAVVAVIFLVVTRLINRSTTTDSCPQTGQTITVSVSDSSMTPANIQAQRCDILKFVSISNQLHVIAVGQETQLVDYPGLNSVPLDPHQSFQVILRLAGDYPIHDHLNPSLETQLNIQ